MSPEEMAALHARAFTMPRPWSAAEFRDLLASPRVFPCLRPGGLLLGQVVLDEAELLTVAVEPDRQGRGIGRQLVADFLAEARARGAATAFLEVAADNAAALAVYTASGFTPTGRRKGYYHGPEGAVDAVLMGRSL